MHSRSLLPLMLLAACAQAAPSDPVGCQAATDCASDERCVSGLCLPRARECEADVGCPEDATCDLQLGVCIESARTGCTITGCAAGETCDALTGACVSAGALETVCTADSACNPPLTICGDGTCIAGCMAAGGEACGADRVCDPATGRCVVPMHMPVPRPPPPPEGCRSASDCSGATPICEVSSGLCRGCAADGDCAGSTPACHVASGACVGCLDNGDCGGTTPICDAARGVCIGCTASAQCPANTPVCHLPSGVCLECLSSADCGASAPICDVAAGACRSCAQAGCPNGQVCNATSGACEAPAPQPAALGGACTSDGDCASNVCFDVGGPTGRRCVRSCQSPADCDPGTSCYMHNGARMCLAPAIAPSTAQAIDCTIDSDCTSGLCVWIEVSSGRYDARCRNALGSGAPQTQCNGDLDCANGMCTVSVNNPNIGYCRHSCATDVDCPASFACVYVEWGSLSYVQASKVCLPVPTLDPPTCQRDAHCVAGERCKILEVAGPRSSATYFANSCLP